MSVGLIFKIAAVGILVTILNQILKTTMMILVRDNQVAAERKSALKRNLVFFDEVQSIDLSFYEACICCHQTNI